MPSGGVFGVGESQYLMSLVCDEGQQCDLTAQVPVVRRGRILDRSERNRRSLAASL